MSKFIERRIPALQAKQYTLAFDGPTIDDVQFSATPDDTVGEPPVLVEGCPSPVVWLKINDFADLGQPEVITVTVEPGDLLSSDATSSSEENDPTDSDMAAAFEKVLSSWGIRKQRDDIAAQLVAAVRKHH